MPSTKKKDDILTRTPNPEGLKIKNNRDGKKVQGGGGQSSCPTLNTQLLIKLLSNAETLKYQIVEGAS